MGNKFKELIFREIKRIVNTVPLTSPQYSV